VKLAVGKLLLGHVPRRMHVHIVSVVSFMLRQQVTQPETLGSSMSILTMDTKYQQVNDANTFSWIFWGAQMAPQHMFLARFANG
jgi:hypothetical protein